MVESVRALRRARTAWNVDATVFWAGWLAALLAFGAFVVPPAFAQGTVAVTGVPCPVQGFGLGTFCYRTDTGAIFVLTQNPPAAPAWVQFGNFSGAGLFALGPGGTPLSNGLVKYSAALTPAATSAAIQTTEQTFNPAGYTGLNTSDVVFVNGPVPTSLCPPVTYRVSAANTLAIGFTTLTAVACTPAAGTYTVWAVR